MRNLKFQSLVFTKLKVSAKEEVKYLAKCSSYKTWTHPFNFKLLLVFNGFRNHILSILFLDTINQNIQAKFSIRKSNDTKDHFCEILRNTRHQEGPSLRGWILNTQYILGIKLKTDRSIKRGWWIFFLNQRKHMLSKSIL